LQSRMIDVPYLDARWFILTGVKWPFLGENHHFIVFFK
jgi:hypothetical protein